MKTLAIIGLVILVLVGGLFLRVALLPLFVAERAVSTTEGVIGKTINADSALRNYEFFHDTYQAVQQQQANISDVDKQIAALKAEYGGKPRPEWDRAGKDRLAFLEDTRNGYVMNHNRLVADYNANSMKLNRRLFKDRGLPYTLEPIR